MLKDRGLLVAGTRGWSWSEGPDFPFPENIQGLIAARLDTLAPDRKALLQDAAVLGKVFWTRSPLRHGGPSTGRRRSGAPRAQPQGVHPCRSHLLHGKGAGAWLLAHVGPRRCLRSDPARRPGFQACRRRGMDRGTGRRSRRGSGPMFSHITTSRRWTSRAQPVAMWRPPRNGRSRSLAWPLDAAPASTRRAPRGLRASIVADA